MRALEPEAVARSLLPSNRYCPNHPSIRSDATEPDATSGSQRVCSTSSVPGKER